MKQFRTPSFERAFNKLPKEVRVAFEKQLGFLLEDIRHPSLRAKKYDEVAGVWQARVTGSVRFYFRIERDTYQLLNIRRHPK